MPLRRNNTRSFYKKLYAGELEKITLLHHSDDFHASTITAYVIFGARRSSIVRLGEPIQGEMLAYHNCVWHIPRMELQRVGVNWINMIDTIVQMEGAEKGNQWRPEADTKIDHRLFSNMIDVACKRCDPTIDDKTLGIAHWPFDQ